SLLKRKAASSSSSASDSDDAAPPATKKQPPSTPTKVNGKLVIRKPTALTPASISTIKKQVSSSDSDSSDDNKL
ncbi:unnamed protein product, partial [Rotaria socialis]